MKNIFEEGELIKEATCAKIAQVQIEGGREVNRGIEFYNLDAIISVGYRVNSTQATHFRIWATALLKEYIIKGFAIDDERLKNPNNIFGKDYFDEQLARIRDIRSSERRSYQKITDIYSQCSADYNVNTQTTKDFFATIQNKLHWAITGQTAAELIVARADGSKENMGMGSFVRPRDLVALRIANLQLRLPTDLYFPIRYKNLSVLKMILSRTMAGVALTCPSN